MIAKNDRRVKSGAQAHRDEDAGHSLRDVQQRNSTPGVTPDARNTFGCAQVSAPDPAQVLRQSGARAATRTVQTRCSPP